jgi:hypothetical protein
MSGVMSALAMGRKSKTQRFRDAIAALFSDREAEALEQLRQFTEREWRSNLLWLDISGMALYLIDHLIRRNAEDAVPAAIGARLKQNLADNRNRTAWLFDEMCAINRDFQKQGISFANLKGMTLCPESVPDPALRCQLDLDFLAATDQSAQVQKIMASMGYRLHDIGHGTWEFKAGHSRFPSVKDLYKAKPQRCAEIHFVDRHEDDGGQTPSTWAGQLQRAQIRSVCGTLMPTLSPADQLLNQALHLFGHLRGEYTRLSWGLEFARHIHAYRDDHELWQEVRALADGVPQAAIALGLTISVVEDLFGPTAPPALRHWTVDTLPAPIALWGKLYGRKALLERFPGSKLYLLLEDALAYDQPVQRTPRRRKLLPGRLPMMITHGDAGESIATRLTRYNAQRRHLIFRLRFHLVEGLRYTLEAPRWQRFKNALDHRQVVPAERLQRNDIL